MVQSIGRFSWYYSDSVRKGALHANVLVTPGSRPFHLAPGIPDPDQLLLVPTVVHLHATTRVNLPDAAQCLMHRSGGRSGILPQLCLSRSTHGL